MNENIHQFMSQKGMDMKSMLLELETDVEIKNKMWELCGKPSRGSCNPFLFYIFNEIKETNG